MLFVACCLPFSAKAQHVTVGGNVYGGGNKAPVAQGTKVLIDQAGAVITGDVYGGGALAEVDTIRKGATPPAITTDDSILVKIMQGTINGNIYGGGLGDSIPAPYSGAANVAAHVYGPVHVYIGAMLKEVNDPTADSLAGTATIGGEVFGCNNLNGSPKSDVLVDVWQTAHTAANTYPSSITTLDDLAAASNADEKFAIKAVYGGGNMAAYTAAGKTATVHIHTCLNTIKTVYGGGNAADATNVKLIVDGGRFDQVFGGGNGYSSNGNHTDASAPNYNPGANISGSATTEIHGGLYRQLFGGSNQKGDVANASLSIDHASESCAELILESFGGANEADITGDITTNLLCSNDPVQIGSFYGGSNAADIDGDVKLNVYGGTYTNVFGGSKGRSGNTSADSANIDGNVTLNLFGGTMVNAFGGSDVNGNITGSINVNMLDFGGTCGLQVNNVFGGGRNAAYTPDDSTTDSITVNIIHGTVSKVGDDHGNVYGGGYGAPAEAHAGTVVNIGYDATLMGAADDNTKLLYSLLNNPNVTATPATLPANYQAIAEGSVYGSGYAAPVTGNATVAMRKANSSTSKLFGGGANAGVGGNTYVTLTNGTVYDGIFGGSDTTGTITGNTVIALNGGYAGTNNHSANYGICGGGWGQPTRVNGNVSMTLDGTSVYGDIYGGSFYGNVNTNSSNTTVVTLTSGSVDGNVYGGGLGDKEMDVVALVNGAVTVNANGATVTGNIFGSNNENGAPQSTVTVNFTGGSAQGVFGGGNLADYAGTPVITVSGGTIAKRVVGGGYAAGVGGSIITISNGAIATAANEEGCGVFGGCYSDGDVSGAITVSVTGGTVGTDATYRANIHGGGYGASTSTNGAVTVNIASNGAGSGPTIYGDIYGGSALGEVSASGLLTQVNFYKGTVNGDIYGGGLGNNNNPAQVSGNVEVNIRGGVFNAADGTAGGGMVFGANNANGTPKGNVAVNIYGTDHGTGIANNEYPSPAPTTVAALATNAETQTYAIAAVYGGGNLASYTPDASKSATVHVYNCDNTIGDVYGGGNAADVGTSSVSTNTNVIIDGGRIHRVFGGGNGEVTEANTYGTATTTVNAGLIDQIFGCGNMQGSITSTSLNLLKASGVGACTDEVWGEVFGGANQASFTGDLSTTIACGVGAIGDIYGGSNKASISGDVSLTINGGTYTNVFGGSKGIRGNGNTILDTAANITGSVTLNLHGGTITNAYGGSNQMGNITSGITVNVLDFKTSCPLNLTNLYGGGNETPYTPTNSSITSPIVNVMHIAQNGGILGSVYGGGRGSTAAVTANPQVTIGYDANMSGYTDGHAVNADTLVAYVTGNVYGGGDAAAVSGNTTVLMQKSNSQVDKLFGGGNAAGVSGTASVTLTSGTVSTGLYGGCNTTGGVGGNITVALNGGTVGTNGTTDVVFGGGYGHPTTTGGDVTVTLGATTVYGNLYGGSALGSVNGSSSNTTTVTIGGANLNGSVFGGGMGSGNDNDHKATTVGNVIVNYNTANTALAGIYGGANVNGSVSGNIDVNIEANVGASGDGNSLDVFGGGKGHYTSTGGDVTVTVGTTATSTLYGDLYGGSEEGEVGASDKIAKVDFKKGTLNGTIYGGGKGTNSNAASVTGGTNVTVTTGTITGGIYGGANVRGTVAEDITVNANGGTIGADAAHAHVFGGGYGNNTATSGDVTVNINGATVWGDVYGGSGFGNVGNDINDAVVVNILNGEVKQSVFGGGLGQKSPNNYAATEAGTVTVNIGSGTPANVTGGASSVTGGATIGGSVYGCNNTNGSPNGDVTVNIFQTAHTSGNAFADAGYAITNVFGGGKNADYTATGKKATVNVYTCDNTIGTLYGGGDAAAVPGTEVNIYGGRIGTVFGGGNGAVTAANVGTGGITLNLHGGTIGTLVSASNKQGTISGAINVTVDNVNGCTETVTDFFGGSNMVDITGDVTTTIECGAGTFGAVYGGSNKANITGNVTLNVQGGTIGRVFGGSKGDLSSLGGGHSDVSADISGTVELNLQGGTIGCAFGGSNINGTIGGDITVNVEDQGGTCPLAIDSVFGAGNLTAYSHTPTVNIKHGTVGNLVDGVVFGGGKGTSAVVTGSPVVNIGDNNAAHRAIVTGSVFGGGDAAAVTGSTTVTYNDNNADSYVAKLYGGGNNIVANGVSGNTQVTLTAGRVTSGIYGGCNEDGTVGGNTTVNLFGGQVGASVARAEIFGGGFGQSTEVTGNVQVTMGNATGTYTPIIYGELYGGSALGNVNTNGSNTTTVDILSGTLHGTIYGGGRGRKQVGTLGDEGYVAPVEALVNGVVHVNVGDDEYNGTANLRGATIYGCNNYNGSPQQDVFVDIYQTAHTTTDRHSYTADDRDFAINYVYGGGNQADYAPTVSYRKDVAGLTSEQAYPHIKKTHVSVHGCENTINEAYGGGNAAAVLGDSIVIDGGRHGIVFGGGNGAVTAANIGIGGVSLTAKGGRVGYIYQHCNKRGIVTGPTTFVEHGKSTDCNEGVLKVDYHFCGGNEVDIAGDFIYRFTCNENLEYLALYGGCRLGTTYGNITLVIEGGTFSKIYGGPRGDKGFAASVKKYPTDEQLAVDYADPLTPDATYKYRLKQEDQLVYPKGVHEYMKGVDDSLKGTGGNVTVILRGGTIGRIYGGCELNGNVEGKITVVVDSIGLCPLDVNYIYGASDLAEYHPDDSTWNSPLIMLQRGHVNNDIFAGGRGIDTVINAGLVTSCPKIIMGGQKIDTTSLITSHTQSLTSTDDLGYNKFWVKGNIYGGGEMASVGKYTRAVNGNPTACDANTGRTTIAISSGKVGPATLVMPTFKGHVFGGSKGAVGDTSTTTGNPKISHLAYVNTSDVTISGTAFIKGSVYGGGESGRIFDSTYVKIQGGQIGCGWNDAASTDLDRVYTPEEWAYDVTSDNTKFLYECNHWPFSAPYNPYDPYENPTAHDGHTFYGNVFGGGSGMMPYKSKTAADKDTSIYIQTSGRVMGNTRVEITGGHILTNIYGGCELGDVTGDSCVVTFGGTATLGVPRTLAQIAAHPVTCYLFGAGKGDERVRFNTRTNVNYVRVTVDGGKIYGSVFGGGEDGHVMRDVLMDIKPINNITIGTWGTSYVDGSVFGGGRGFSGNALTAGNVGGDITVNITGGTMLGSVYGGGRLASVGCGLYPATDTNYGVMRPDNQDDAGNTVAGFSRGHITVNISGNTVIGNDNRNIDGEYDYNSEHSKGGNVFGGSMGRLTKLDGTMVLSLWHRLGCAKATTVNIRDNVHVKGNVYGGSELGRVTDSITVNISGNVTVGRKAASTTTSHGNVYGGGFGHGELTAAEKTQVGNAATSDSIPTFAGLTGGTIKVNISGGAINNNVYGAGEMASVGTIDEVIKHTDSATTYYLSWPYEYTYHGTSGDARVNITGGKIGYRTGSTTTGGDIFGSARGTVGDRYVTGKLATARVTHVDINLAATTDTIFGTVYGSGENGHVYDSAVVTLRNGLVLGSVFGGGKGTDQYTDQLKNPTTGVLEDAQVYDIIAGKVFGNTKVNILGGRVAKNVYGGGNLASVGKGNYKKYGEGPNVSAADSLLAENSGHCYVNILGGIIGPDSIANGTIYNGNYAVTTGHVYGAGKGIVFPTAPKVGFDYDRDYYVAYVNKTFVVIGDSNNRSCQYTSSDPHVTGIVFGGGENGHVRFDTYVQTNRGQIGVRPLDATGTLTSDVGHWANRGNIFGAGRGEDKLSNGKYCQSAGSVTRNTTIDVLGARIYRNVQGGGAMASVGPIKGRTGDSSTCVINVRLPQATDTLGGPSNTNNAFGGYIGGGSRGIPSPDGTRNDSLATCYNSQINFYQGRLKNTIYGGGENGQMLGNTEVNVFGGYVRSAIYGGGKGSYKADASEAGMPGTYLNDTLSGYVYGNTEVNLMGGEVPYTYGGGRRASSLGTATINIGKDNGGTYEGDVKFQSSKRKVYGGNQYAGSPRGNIYVNVYKTAHTTTDAASYTEDDGSGAPAYAIGHVYGGSYNSDYLPNRAGRYAQVHVYGCENTIGEVYGGCAAADAGVKPGIGASTKLIIDGGRFNKVFGGGDGTFDRYIGTPVPANIHGTATTEIHGGTIGSLFGGSNFMGQADTIRISVDNSSGCGNVEGDEFFGGSNVADLGPTVLSTTLGCGVKFRAAYGGSNQADIIGNVSLTIEGGEFEEVYAGSKGAIVSPSARQGQKDTAEANIAGNTHLIIKGGKVGSAFGGSNINGNITGTITVDIDSTYDKCDWDVDYVYGGSNLTQYIPDDTTVTNYTYSPKVNILCGTVNNDVYGGGKGDSDVDTAGLMHANPQVAMSQTNKGNTWVKGSIYGGGELAQTDGSTQVSVSGGKVGSSSLGGAHYGNVYGGGMGNETTISAGLVKKNTKVFISGGHIYHAVYGGGEQASVGTFTYDNSKPYYSRITALASNTGHAEVYITGGIIGHNSGDSNEDGHENGMVYGSSRGDIAPLGNIRDALAWVGSTTVCIGDTTEASGSPVIQGSTYGGGENGHVYKDAYVRIHRGTIGNINDISYGSRGNVYGAGCGTDELDSDSDGEDDSFNPESGIVRGNTWVNITGGQVANAVYGGGSMGSVGTYTYDADGLPENPAANTGKCYVTVSGGIVGPITSQLVMPAYVGMVFGGTRGETVDTTRYTQMPRLANCRTTEVEISGTAFIKGSVYGGCKAGHVLGDTWVKVQGGQVGCGKGQSEAYSAEVFKTIPLAEDLPADWPDYECPSWPYGVNVGTEGNPQIVYAAYDKFASTEAGHEEEYPDGSSTATGRASGSDGHTFYGNVFGGGSGYFPYAAGKWVRSAGRVNGNTQVDITGGHIITSIYGGNECTDVLGTATVNFGGTATLGVPRTLAQIDNHPVTCYLFGAGKGDERIFFNQWTNVASATVTVDGGTIYGSVFGGGEDGHVLGNATVNINNDDGYNAPIIGTEGLSYVDGNVFGGGRGFSGHALTAGAVCGNVTVTIKDGTMLGSIYGGGRLASVGTYLAPVNDPNYGKMQEGNNHGFILVNISGGTIGNLAPYVFFSGDKPAKLSKASYGTVKIKNGKGQRYEDLTNILTHTTSGNVFGGCMGRVTLLDGTTNPVWPDLARAKKTRVVISGSTIIRSSVYGGGEMGTVRDSTTVLVYGGTIGTDIAPDDASLKTALSKYSNATKFANFYADTGHYFYDENFDPIATPHASPSQYRNGAPHYYFGSVFGGGYGNLSYDDPGIDLDINHTPDLLANNAPDRLPAVEIAGRVYGNTYVRVKGGIIRENVYGGGDLASVGTPYYASSSDAATEGVSEGDMLRYNDGTGVCHVVVGDTIINAVTYSPVIGPIDFTAQNGNVYAAGKGVGIDPDEHYKEYCNVASTDLKVSGGKIWGNTFGGGADCHVLYNTKSLIEAGVDNGDINVGLPDIGDMGITEYDGYVFGGGRNFYNTNATAGRVGGHTSVKVTGGRIRCSVIGGGALARVGVDVDGDVDSFVDNSGNYDSTHHGSTYITVSGIKETVTSSVFNSKYKAMFVGTTEADGGNVVVYHTTIGTGVGPHLLDCDYTIGDIFGGGKGDTRDTVDLRAGRVMNTYITVTGSPRIMADIYAGGEMGGIGWWNNTGVKTGAYYANTGYTSLKVSDTPYLGTPYEFTTKNYRSGVTWSIVDSTGRLYHTCSGNIYGGGQGFVEEGYTNWVHMGRVRKTNVLINGVRMLGNVFGGGSRGVVTEDCYVTVNGGHIGTEIEDSTYAEDNGFDDLTTSYYYGSVFGGGYGNPKLFVHVNDSSATLNDRPARQAGRVYGNTTVNITGGTIMDCVFGGGDLASTGYVERDSTESGYYKEDLDNPAKRHGGKCTVNISGNAVVGPLDKTGHNAYVYAAGRGVGVDPDQDYKRFCNVNEAHLTVNLTTSGDKSTKPESWNASTMGGRIWGSLFGGGADSHVLDSVSVVVHSGLVGTQGTTSYDGNIFGGGRNYLNTNHTNGRVQGNIRVLMDGGTLQGTIFGGGRLALSGVDVDGHFIDKDHGNVDILVCGNATIGTSNADSLLFADESCGDIFGSGKGDIKNYEDIWAGRVTNATITVRDATGGGSPRIYGSIFGGGEMASLGYWDDTIRDGNDIVFYTTSDEGTNYGVMYENTGRAVINLSGNLTVGSALEYTVAPYKNPGNWTIYESTATDTTLIHTCTGNVFGGGQGDVDPSAPRWVSMGRSASALVNISGGTYYGNIFGGSEQGIVTGDTRLNISGGSFGYTGQEGTIHTNLHKVYTGDIYAAGYGSDDPSDNAIPYEYDDDEGHHTIENPINDSIGHRATGLSGMPDVLAGRTYGDAQVDITGGTIHGSVYGGGSFASVGYELSSTKGNTTVNIGLPGADPEDKSQATGNATIDGEVFGANNFSGTPYGNTNVHIYKTAHDGNDACPSNDDANGDGIGGWSLLATPNDSLTREDVLALSTADNAFALSAVYGGGNRAAHTPIASSSTTLVHVHYCDENTIRTVYGGGNAASTQNNHIIIDGGRIKEVFGGGNGVGENNPGADVHNTAWTQIKGGLINDVFGGSNAKGVVTNTRLEVEKGTCDMMVANTYGGGNEAEGGGGVVTVGCGTKMGNFYGGSRNADLNGDVILNITGGTFENVFGGSQGTPENPANITGNVTVNFYGGNIENLYGGSDVNGNISGTLLVNVDIDPDYDCPDGLRLDNVYGAGRDAAYTPYDPYRGSPTVNIMNNRHKPAGGSDSAWVEIQDVFGGGLGATATVTSYPRVIIGGFEDGSKTVNETPVIYHRAARIFGNAYGGGNAAPVKGNTLVMVRDAVIGRDDQVESFTSGNLFGGGYGSTSKVMGDTYVGVFGLSDIKSNVYGGGNAGIVTGNTKVVVGYQKQVIVPELIAYADTINKGQPNQQVKIMAGLHSATPGVHFRYTTDGSIPTTTTGTLYTDDILSEGHNKANDSLIDFGQKIQMIAYLWDDVHNKIDSTMIPSIVGFDRSTSPLITIKDGKATFDGTVGARVYYTLDGSKPTISSTLWATIGESEGSPVTIGDTDVVKAFAVQRGCFDSDTSFLVADAPTVDNGDNNTTFTITAQPGERIIYTVGTTDIPTPISLMNRGRRPGQGPGETGMTESTDDAPGHTASASAGSTVTHKKRVYTNSNGVEVTYRWSEVTAASSGNTTVTITFDNATVDHIVKAICERAGHVPSPLAADVYRAPAAQP